MGDLFIGIPMGAKAGFDKTTGIESTVFNSYQMKGTKGKDVAAGRLKRKIKKGK